MKALFLHANKFGGKVESPSERLGEFEPDYVGVEDDFGQGCFTEEMQECLVVLFQVEAGDGEKAVRRICKDAKRIADLVGTRRILLGAFGHLSHKWPENPEIAKRISHQVVGACQSLSGFEVRYSPFGHNKTLLLDVKGHQHAIKHRSYE